MNEITKSNRKASTRSKGSCRKLFRLELEEETRLEGRVFEHKASVEDFFQGEYLRHLVTGKKHNIENRVVMDEVTEPMFFLPTGITR